MSHVETVATRRRRGLLAGRPSLPVTSRPAPDLYRRRWRGQPGRVEVWYATGTDAATGTGLWIHHELVSPSGGVAGGGRVTDGPHAHGWIAVFPPGRPAHLERFGPHPAGGDGDVPAVSSVSAGPTAPAGPGEFFAVPDVTARPDRLRGRAGEVTWDLGLESPGPPLFTFGRRAWQHELLPGAQVVPAPTALLTGSVLVGGERLEVAGPGALARVYGRGNAQRWAWLHADLGSGDVLEVVSAVPRRAGLRRLAPLPVVRLRLGGHDWPRASLLAAACFRAEPGLPSWTLRGRVGSDRLDAEVTLDPADSVTLEYRDPDGSPAFCTNSERATARVRWQSGRDDREWHLDRTAHAEVGLRPEDLRTE